MKNKNFIIIYTNIIVKILFSYKKLVKADILYIIKIIKDNLINKYSNYIFIIIRKVLLVFK